MSNALPAGPNNEWTVLKKLGTVGTYKNAGPYLRVLTNGGIHVQMK